MSEEQYAAALPQGIGRNYWHVARNRILWNKLQRTLRPSSCVLDVGCGPGIVVDFLRRKGVDCFGSDLGTPVPESAAVAPYLYLGQDAFQLDASFRERVDTLLLMDVLEHLPEPQEFLRTATSAFPNLAAIHVTVPARMEIWSNYDEYFGHFRRYSLASVAELATLSGLRVAESGYAFHGLYAAARAAKLVSNRRSTKLAAPGLPLAHSILGAMFELEHRVLPAGLKGSSIFALLTKSA
jgi:SAM-dependent methyltransferase